MSGRRCDGLHFVLHHVDPWVCMSLSWETHGTRMQETPTCCCNNVQVVINLDYNYIISVIQFTRIDFNVMADQVQMCSIVKHSCLPIYHSV